MTGFLKSVTASLSAALWIALTADAISTATPLSMIPHAAAQQTPIPLAPKAGPDFIYNEAPDDHAIGSNLAPASLIIYASVTCPHCGSWFNNEWQTIKTELVDTGELRVVFREFPTAPGQIAMAEFIIANCAAKDTFFDQIEHQMAKQGDLIKSFETGETEQVLRDIAAHAGLTDENALNNCLQESAHIERITRATERARASGLKGVPGFFLNGEVYEGKQDAKTMIDAIRDANAGGISTFK